MTCRLRAAAVVCTVGATPWAENTTIAPSGTSSVSSTNTAPALASVSTTWRLCTISWRTYTGAPCFSSARSTVSTARSTPAQYPRGSASSTRLPSTGAATERVAPGIPMLIVSGMGPGYLPSAYQHHLWDRPYSCTHGYCPVRSPSAGRRRGDRAGGNSQAAADRHHLPDDDRQPVRPVGDEDAAGRRGPGESRRRNPGTAVSAEGRAARVGHLRRGRRRFRRTRGRRSPQRRAPHRGQ